MSLQKIIKGGGLVAGVALIILVLAVLVFGLGRNDDQNWQVKQSIMGNVTIIDQPGWYLKLGASVWTWPRSQQKFFSSSEEEGGAKDRSVRVTFNDGGQAQVSFFCKIQTPTLHDQRRKAHRDFSGRPDNMMEAVRSYLINCAKATAPLMSASEHQSARKAEFTQLVHEQLTDGLYEMRKIEKELKDRTDERGQPITVFATEIVRDENNNPVIAQASPLEQYGIQILQFSVTATEYDPETLAQFKAKKESYLAAEKSKAQREQEVQQRLMVVEKFLREKAEVEGQANKEKAQATIAAQQEKEVAELQAAKKVAVAEQERLQAEKIKQKALIDEQRELEVAELRLQAAKKQAQAKIVLAEARQKEINLAGMITEKDKLLATIKKEMEVGVAEALSKVNVPSMIIVGGEDGGVGTDPIKLFGVKMLQDIQRGRPEITINDLVEAIAGGTRIASPQQQAQQQ